MVALFAYETSRLEVEEAAFVPLQEINVTIAKFQKNMIWSLEELLRVKRQMLPHE